MSKDMKLIMENFRSFVKESTKEGSPCTERGVDAEHMGGQWQIDQKPSSRTFPDLVCLFSSGALFMLVL